MVQIPLAMATNALAIRKLVVTVPDATPRTAADNDGNFVNRRIGLNWDYGNEADLVNRRMVGVNDCPGTCADGSKQSPANIETPKTTAESRVCPFPFNHYKTIPLYLKLKNKWHSVYFWKLLSLGTKPHI